MGWKEGIGVLVIMIFALPYIFQITSKIPGMADDGVAIFAMLSWVVTAFTNREVSSSTYAAINNSMEMRKYQRALQDGMNNLPNVRGRGPGMAG